MATAAITMHPHMAFDVIQRQAGTLTKAIMEGVMNSVDAGATVCNVHASETEVTISDDGCGVTSRQAVDDCLLQLGRPHTEAEKKVYGRFRMGRGQMWAFGRNTWRTGPFELLFDIRESGLDVDVQDDLPAASGCRIKIELYTPLDQMGLYSLKLELERGVTYCPVPVFFNNERLSVPPESCKWTHDTDEAYIRLDDSATLRLYNMGVFVTSFEANRYGSGGVITTKRPLTVNYARNDVMSDCPVWRAICDTLDTVIDRNAAADKSLSEAAKNALLQRMLRGVLVENAEKLKLFALSDGRQLTAKQLWAMAKLRPVTSATNNDVRADRMLQMSRAVCVSATHLRALGCSVEDYLFVAGRILNRRGDRASLLHGIRFEDIQSLWGLAEFDTELIPEKNYRPSERMWLDLLDRVTTQITGFLAGRDGGGGWATYDSMCKMRRKLLIGRSSTAQAWTDGVSYIAFDRTYLAARNFDLAGIIDVMQVFCHEYAHDDGTTGSHTHGTEFHAKLDGLLRARLSQCIRHGLSVIPNVFKKAKRQQTRKVLRNHDVLAALRDCALRTYQDLNQILSEQPDEDAAVAERAPELAGVG